MESFRKARSVASESRFEMFILIGSEEWGTIGFGLEGFAVSDGLEDFWFTDGLRTVLSGELVDFVFMGVVTNSLLVSESSSLNWTAIVEALFPFKAGLAGNDLVGVSSSARLRQGWFVEETSPTLTAIQYVLLLIYLICLLNLNCEFKMHF